MKTLIVSAFAMFFVFGAAHAGNEDESTTAVEKTCLTFYELCKTFCIAMTDDRNRASICDSRCSAAPRADDCVRCENP